MFIPRALTLAPEALVALAALALVAAYFIWLNNAMLAQPTTALARSPMRFTSDGVQEAAARMRKSPVTVDAHLPRRTGNRYIVLGGSGFLGGWIVMQLLQRGEDPRRIRILDVVPPSRKDLTTGRARDVAFFRTDVSDRAAVDAAFDAPWPGGDDSEPVPITVFHTVAVIRFYERHKLQLPDSARVNVAGTQNVVDAARRIGVTTLVYTSSGSILINPARFWVWPWEREPQPFVNLIDDDTPAPETHEAAWSNYAVTKIAAEKLVRQADRSPSGTRQVLRTGCLRPGNGIFGPGGDLLAGAFLVRKINPTWIWTILQNFVYVENAALAHLQYERALLDTGPVPEARPSDSAANAAHTGDAGGQAYTICDPNPAITFGDLYLAESVLTAGAVTFPRLPPVVLLVIAHAIEAYSHLRLHLLGPGLLPASRGVLARLLPPVTGDLLNLQPALMALTSVHLIFDDSRARLPRARGGIGYSSPFTTIEGICKVVDEFRKNGGKAEYRQAQAGAGGISFGLVEAQRRAEKADENRVIAQRLA